MSHSSAVDANPSPLKSIDEWDDFMAERYPEADAASISTNKDVKEFRNYEAPARSTVREFYRLNHLNQTYDFVMAKEKEYKGLNHREMSIWEAMDYLNTLVDDSDPDTDFTQIEHLMQTSEAIRRDGHPRWFILAGLIHDLGKMLCLYGEPQWAVVGDTFPVGCAYSDKVVYPEYFAANPDAQNPKFQTPCGVYEEGCGLDKVHLSWGHDEYIYTVAKNYLPEPALYMLRYHSFYACHKEGAYQYLMNDHDRAMFKWVRAFNPYDLYSKGADRPNVAALKPFYDELIAEYFPAKMKW
jgi:inositol oxygenase